jgi:hypothetical protein
VSWSDPTLNRVILEIIHSTCFILIYQSYGYSLLSRLPIAEYLKLINTVLPTSAVAKVYAPVAASTLYCPVVGALATRFIGTAFESVTPKSLTYVPAFGTTGVTKPPAGIISPLMVWAIVSIPPSAITPPKKIELSNAPLIRPKLALHLIEPLPRAASTAN